MSFALLSQILCTCLVYFPAGSTLNQIEQLHFILIKSIFVMFLKVFRQKQQKHMKKKYLIKQPSCQLLQRQESIHLNNQSTLLQHRTRRSQPKDMKMVKNILKTEGNVLDYTQISSSSKMKVIRILKKSDSSAKLIRKGNYYFPSNKQNSKVIDQNNSNRFTFNEFRDHEIRETLPQQREITNTFNRNSEAKQIPRQSFQKNKGEKYRFCSPKTQPNCKQFNSSLDMKPLHMFNRHPKENKQNLSESKPHQEIANICQSDLEIDELIGSGTFGKVFSARLKSSGEMVALKRVQQDRKYKTRQLEIIKMLKNPFIIKNLGTFTTEEGKYEYLNIAMEAYQFNYFQLMRMHPINGLDAKIFVYQMLRGLNYMHSNGVCHRDLKPQNMLVKGKRLVICDFGSAKVLHPGEQNISYICSRCYRAPELIFQSTNYSTQIDMWSLGCILLEMLNGRPLFIADSSLNHILEVIKVLGTPTKQEVRAMNPSYELSQYDLPKIKGKSLKKMFPQADDQFLNLIEKLACYSPNRRITAAQALRHPFFDELREQKAIKTLSHITNFTDFFSFDKNEIPEAMKERLIPRWMKKL